MKKRAITNYPLFIFIILNILSLLLLFYFIKKDFSNYIVFNTLTFLLLLWLPYLLNKIININFPKVIFQIYYLVLITDLLIGKVLMFEKLISIYILFSMLLQGLSYYIIGTWLISFLDDYGFLSYKIVLSFSFMFSLAFSFIKEMLYYFLRYTFNQQLINHLINLIIAFFGALIILVLAIIDNIYYKGKYFKMLEIEFNKKR